MRIGDGDAGQPVLARERGRRPRCRSPTSRALWTSTQSTSGAIAASSRALARASPRNRSNGCGMPTSAALLAGRARSSRRPAAPAGCARSRNAHDQVAVGGLDLLADDDGQPVGRRVARPQRAVDPVVVRDRRGASGHASTAARTTDRDRIARQASRSSRRRVAVQVDERAVPDGQRRSPRLTGPATPAVHVRSAGRATS